MERSPAAIATFFEVGAAVVTQHLHWSYVLSESLNIIPPHKSQGIQPRSDGTFLPSSQSPSAHDRSADHSSNLSPTPFQSQVG